MTNQEINKVIAEAMGWQDVVICDDGKLVGLPPGFTEDQCPEGADETSPDFCNDMNAAHKAEKWLFKANRPGFYNRSYGVQLRIVLGGEDSCCDVGMREAVYMIHAEAHQRAEAIVRTLGKWKD